MYFLGLVRMIKGNCLDKLCFYYPVVKTKSDNNKIIICIYIYIRISIITQIYFNKSIYLLNFKYTCKIKTLFPEGTIKYKTISKLLTVVPYKAKHLFVSLQTLLLKV